MTDEPLPVSILAEELTLSTPSSSGRPGPQQAARWSWGLLLAVNLALLLGVLSFAHVTAEGPAKRSLGQSVAILTEVDAFLDLRLEALRQEAGQTQQANIALAGFPVPVSFTPAEILDSGREEFRALLLARSAEQIYENGTSVFREDRGGEARLVSPAGALRRGMDFLRPGPHTMLTVLTWALAATAAFLALRLAQACRGYGRLVGLGASVSLAALPFILLAMAVRFALQSVGGDEYLARAFAQLGEELTWAPIRNGIIFGIGGLLLLALGTTLARWSDRRQPL